MRIRHLAAGLFLGMAICFSLVSAASAETRTLKLYFVHTKERAEITYKKDGRFIKSGLQQLNRFLRDWRRNESTNMDPRLMDLLWEVYRASGSRDYIHVLSAYRSPATNGQLRSRSKGVAENSQHMKGRAIDFYLPDVKLAHLRNLGLKMQVGGVGYYPKSGSPFVHLDVASVRHWPRLSRQELVSVFPDGKTVHVPSDGKPLPGYQQALAMLKNRKEGAPILVADDTTTRRRRGGGLLARIFGGGVEEEEDMAEAAQTRVASAAPARQRAAAPAPQPAPQQAPAPLAIAPAPQQIQPPEPETPAAILASLTSLPLPQSAPRRTPLAVEPEPVVTAAVAPADVAPAAAPAPASDEVAALLAATNVPLPTQRPDYAPATQVAMAAATDSSITLPAVAYVTPSRRPEMPKTVDVIANLLNTQPAEPAVANAPEKAEEVALAFASSQTPTQPVATGTPVGASKQLALMEAGATARPIASAPKVAPKGSRPSAQDLPRAPKPSVKPVTARVPAALMEQASVAETDQIATLAYSSRLAEAPTAVYTTGFTRTANAGDARRFSGKAVQFMPIAKFQ